MTAQQTPDRDALRRLADAATPAPWERGNWYHVQASTHCTCHQSHGPLVGIDPRGEYGEMHVHRYSDAPMWNEGIRARDDSIGGVDVVIESDEYGTMSDADAEFIAAARTAIPALLDALDQAETRLQAVRDVHRRYGVYELEDSCNIAGDQHREEHHHECSDDAGEFYCDLLPIGAQCDECRDSYGDRVNWPCPTIRALDGDNGA